MKTSERADMKFIVIDDEMHIRKIIKSVCLSMGVGQVIEASDGRSALEILKSKKVVKTKKGKGRHFDLIICDWMMPEMSGLDLLRTVKKDPLLKKVPFLMVTAEGDRDLVMEAIKEGVNDYIKKPFTANTLEEKICKVLQIK